MKKRKKVSIRLGCSDDIILIYNMERAAFFDAWSESQLRSHLSTKGTLLIAETEVGEVVGYALLKGVIDEWELYRIAVAEKYRYRGIGNQLLRFFLEKNVRLTGTIRLFLEVRRSNSARLFYQKLGFVESGKRKKYYSDGEDCILYTLEYTDS